MKLWPPRFQQFFRACDAYVKLWGECRNLFLGQGITHHRGSSVARLQGVDHPSRRLADAAGNQQNHLKGITTSTFLVYENMQLSNFLLKMPFWGGYIIGKRGHRKRNTEKERSPVSNKSASCDCFLEVVSTMSDGTHQSMASYRWKVGQQQSGGIRDWGWHAARSAKKWDQDSVSVDFVVFLLMSNDLDQHVDLIDFIWFFVCCHLVLICAGTMAWCAQCIVTRLLNK